MILRNGNRFTVLNMAVFNIFCYKSKFTSIFYKCLYSTSQANIDVQDIRDDEFRVLELHPKTKMEKKSQRKFSDAQVMPPREKKMPIDQDWPTVWPTARTFQPSVVPLAVYQGYSEKKAPPGKYANAELMKIPNFLHLTPPAIKRHCEAIKKFCTEWPRTLETDKKCDEYFPLEIVTTDYCHSSPTIRDERSRIVTMKVILKQLKLDYHAKDKILRLAGNDRYNAKTDCLVIVADRCPLRKQNYDYLIYILTALYHESKITEPWESEKTEADMEKFFFEGSRIQKCIMDTLNNIRVSSGQEQLTIEQMKENKDIKTYGISVSQIINEGETTSTIQQYKDCVSKLLRINVQVNKIQHEVLPSN